MTGFTSFSPDAKHAQVTISFEHTHYAGTYCHQMQQLGREPTDQEFIEYVLADLREHGGDLVLSDADINVTVHGTRWG